MTAGAVAYARVSSTEQSQYGVSLDDQRQRLLLVRPDAQLLSDPAVSTTVPLVQRPAGALLLRSIEDGSCRTVLATRLDRLFRNAAEALTTVAYWQKLGVSLIVLDLNGSGMVDVCSPNGWLMFSIKAAFDEFERRTIGARTQCAMQHLKETHTEGWTSKKSGRFVRGLGNPRQHTANTIEWADRLHRQGLSFAQVADAMNRDPEAPKPARSDAWTARSLQSMLWRKR